MFFATQRPKFLAGSPLPPGSVEPKLISASDFGVLLSPDGSLWVWGGAESRLISFLGMRVSSIPVRLGTNCDWQKIAASSSRMLALKQDGTLWVWCDSDEDSTTSSDVASGRRIGSDNDWAEIRAGGGHCVALKQDGSLWTWGGNMHGQLGTGMTGDQPVRVGENFKAIAADTFSTFGLRKDGTIWMSGFDPPSSQAVNRDFHQLGSETNWVQISAAAFCLLALKDDGSLWIRGANARFVAPASGVQPGQVFARIGTDRDWAEIYMGRTHFFARKKDRSWWVCGGNSDGQLGLGGSADVQEITSPLRLPFNFEPWAIAIGADRGTTLILLRDGTVWSCGIRLGEAKLSSKYNSLKARANGISIRLPGKPVIAPIRQFPADTTLQRIWALPPEVVGNLARSNSSALELRETRTK